MRSVQSDRVWNWLAMSFILSPVLLMFVTYSNDLQGALIRPHPVVSCPP